MIRVIYEFAYLLVGSPYLIPLALFWLMGAAYLTWDSLWRLLLVDLIMLVTSLILALHLYT